MPRKSRRPQLRAGAARMLSPWSEAWRRAIHTAGQCLAADELGVKVTRVTFDPERGGAVRWVRASSAYRYFFEPSTARLLVETDVIVALAGGVAMWLHQPTEITAHDLRAGDTVADSLLMPLTTQTFVVPEWREYLRNRAIALLNGTESKAVIAWTAAHLIRGGAVGGNGLHTFIAEARRDVFRYLKYDVNIAEYILMFGLPAFALPVERLPIAERVADALRGARVLTLGDVVSKSAAELAQLPGIGEGEIAALAAAAAEHDLALAPRAIRRQNADELFGLSAEYIYRRDVGEKMYEARRGVSFNRNWPQL